jgi:tellurite resistance protein TerC
MQIYVWLGFILLIFILLAIDIGVFNKKDHVPSTKEAFIFTCIWISTAMLFNVVIYYLYDNQIFGLGLGLGDEVTANDASLKFLTGYIIEYALSMDNIFVIAIIFNFFKVPKEFQHRVLFWGILGALVFRAVMILAGTALIHRFDWLMYVFGVLLLYSSYKMLFGGEEEIKPEDNKLVQFMQKFYPSTNNYHGNHFFVVIDGIKTMTPLFICLIFIETTDIFFAIDSIPAIFSVTTDSFIVFTSNIFAILGLRSLYIVLASMMDQFKYMKVSLVLILAFVGFKMLIADIYHVPILVSLFIIVGVLLGGIGLSFISDKKNKSLS